MSKQTRSKNSYHTTLYQLAKDIWVVCPQCEKRAIIDTGGFHSFEKTSHTIKLVCSHCGHNKYLENVIHRIDPKQKQGKVLIFGEPIDPFFHIPLWLQSEFEGNILWAYNLEHLQLLEEHVGAKLRERNQQNFNVRSLGARLPKWMTAAHNREAILKQIQKLKAK
ncbi:MAG: TFIIB-type zinc ribbon-containing protein [Saprospiraceae bacterium]|nr:TFIIB-type zinc ribbon-containing protein [Saprospiraceae bacterium]